MIVMSIDYLISMAEKRLAQLQQARRNSEDSGDLSSVISLGDEIIEVEATIAKLKSLQE